MRLVNGRKIMTEKVSMYILMVFTLSNLWGHIMVIDLNFISRLIVTAMVGGGVHLMLTYPFITMICLGLTIIPLLILHKYGNQILSLMFPWVQQFLQNVRDYFGGTEHIISDNLIMFWLLITFCLSVIVWLILIKFKQAWILPIIYIPIFLYYWYIYVDLAYPMMIMFFVIYFVLLGGQQYFHIERFWVKKKINFNTGLYQYWIKTAFIYGMIIILLATLLPKGTNMIDWNWLQNEMVTKFPAIVDFRDDVVYGRSYGQADLFTFSSTGFQENPELGGPVILKDQLIMEIKSSYPFYLRGNVKTIYKNNRWEKERTKKWVYDINSELPSEVVGGQKVELEINYVNMASYTIFSPYQAERILSERNGRFNYDKNYELVKISGIYKNENYKIEANVPNITEINHLMEANKDNQEDKDPHLEYIREDLKVYLQLPEELSPKIAELADKIVGDEEHPYNKAQVIGNYLRSNYDYTLEPSVTPVGKEFIEYFLFEEKQGYCTYFATAMAVLLRTQGVPTRYIEGYRMPDKKNKGKYEVRLENAHAWVEAYIEPVGWMTFEPTPAFDPPTSIVDRIIANQGERESDLTLDPIRIPQLGENNGGAENWMEGLEDDRGYLFDRASEDSFSKITKQTIRILPRLLYLFLLAGIILRGLYIYLKTERYYNKMKNEKSSKSIPNIYGNILHIMKELDLSIELGETPYEYTDRIISRVYDSKYNFREVTEIYMKTKYGEIEAEKQEVEFSLNYLWNIEKKLKVYLGFWRFSFKKYIKGNIINFNA